MRIGFRDTREEKRKFEVSGNGMEVKERKGQKGEKKSKEEGIEMEQENR